MSFAIRSSHRYIQRPRTENTSTKKYKFADTDKNDQPQHKTKIVLGNTKNVSSQTGLAIRLNPGAQADLY